MKTHELNELGFRKAGVYADGRFHIDPEWARQQVVYVWVRDPDQIYRVGIATGPNGFGARYNGHRGYNRWLAGQFKANDAREQAVRGLFLSRLEPGVEVWARRVSDKEQALREETELRVRWGAMLHLDLMVRDSWAKRQMRAWRAANGSTPATIQAKPAPVSATAPARSVPVPPTALPPVPIACRSVSDLRREMDARLCALGLQPSPVKDGVSYKMGRNTICRIDPKQDFLRVEVGKDAERSAPRELRGQYQQQGWLVVWPRQAAQALAYVDKCARARLAHL